MSSHYRSECRACGNRHEKQAFVSHARKDKDLAEKVRNACCEVNIASFLYEFSPEVDTETPPAEVISREIARSDIVFVLLGESVSSKFWTQAWIGFEIGVSKGIDIATESLGFDSKRVIVLQDIRQGIEVTVPRLDALFLFDFESAGGWNNYRGLVQFLTRTGTSFAFFRAGNRFREYVMKAEVKCGNESCKSKYVSWIAIDDAPRLPVPMTTNANDEGLFEATCTIECPSCFKTITRSFVQML